MIKVYFETPNHSYAEIVAIFDSETTYNYCFNGLRKLAKENNMIITESLEDEIEIKDLKPLN